MANDNGIKKEDNENQLVYLITTENDYKIKATDNHRLISQTGYTEASNFKVGDKIAVVDSQNENKMWFDTITTIEFVRNEKY